MKLYSHRGNIFGKTNEENTTKAIIEAITLAYNVEVDFWVLNNRLFLGHDLPEEEINLKFLIIYGDKMLFHAKNVNALRYCLSHNMHCFYHDKDDYTLSSNGIPICYPNRTFFNNCLLMKAEFFDFDKSLSESKLYGICSDYIGHYR